MRIQQLDNTDIAILANNDNRQQIAECYRDDGYYSAEAYILKELTSTLSFVQPEWITVLTDAPILAEWVFENDDGNMTIEGNVYWFPNYMITDPWRQLANTGRVVFQNSNNA